MEIEAYKEGIELEKSHWWFTSNREMIFSFIDTYYPKKDSQRRILDAGCGSGIILEKLQKYGTAYGVELSDYQLKFCRKRGLKNVFKSSIDRMPFKSRFFDVVGCFGVLYHRNVGDDIKALKEFYRVCKKGGRVFITTPALNLPFSEHDRLQHTKRRYTAADMRKKLGQVGFKVERLSYYNFFIFPMAYLKRLMESMFNLKAQDVKKETPLVNSLLKSIMSFEIFLMGYINLPFGVSLICVARKP